MGRTGYNEQGLNAKKKRERVSAVLLFIAAPLTLFITFRFLGSAKFMVAGLLIVIYAMIPFFMIFERRKPKAREIVLVAMMTALTVTSHLLFHVTIPIEIGTAMVRHFAGTGSGLFGRGAGAFCLQLLPGLRPLYPVADVLLGLAWLPRGTGVQQSGGTAFEAEVAKRG